jgi:tetratricopeptide (TPR) repeat protein
LRDEGQRHAERGDWNRALELYDLSILMHSRPAHVYYLRGLVKEEKGELKRAIRDWERCLERHRTHHAARGKLSRYKGSPSPTVSPWRIAYGAAALAALIVLIGLWGTVNWPTQ